MKPKQNKKAHHIFTRKQHLDDPQSFWGRFYRLRDKSGSFWKISSLIFSVKVTAFKKNDHHINNKIMVED